ncbi:MAG: hypothetical protein SFX74_08050 [Fimbriimonadaceae bacterium]|nr:hypothetical protein [Fimbriimonadaceae bacterium]
MKRAMTLAVVIAGMVLGCQNGPEAGPVAESEIKEAKTDTIAAKAAIDEKIRQIKSSNLTPEQKERALAVLGAR